MENNNREKIAIVRSLNGLSIGIQNCMLDMYTCTQTEDMLRFQDLKN